MIDVEELGLILLVDIDDLLVFSSPKLQEIVNEKTNFKTEVLHMFEQLNRNCRYLVNEVKLECDNAQKENRKPDLKRFGVFKDYVCDKVENMYTGPVQAVEYYRAVADKLLNQFLEERDTFLEIDNMPKGSRKYFNYEKEMDKIIEFSEFINNNKEAFHEINKFCLKQAKSAIKKAKKHNGDGKLTIPKYGALVSMDSNDIIKKNSLSNTDDAKYRKYVLYRKPLHNIENCIKNENRMHDIITNARVFFKPSEEIVNYRAIHSEANVNWKAVAFIKLLIKAGIFKKVCFSTHHNGDREVLAKMELMQKIFPEIPKEDFIEQRFHDEEHDANRRTRSSKILKASYKLHVLPSLLALLDDSKANCEDCVKNDALPILYKALTDSEIINGMIEETGFNRIMNFDQKEAFEFICELCRRHKVKCLKK